MMTPERMRQIEAIFHAACNLAPSERAAFLSQACANDDALRREVELLLASDEQAGTLIEAPAIQLVAPLFAESKSPSLTGKSISHYQIISPLGKGGMGEVYCARDTKLDRTVALKILPAEVSTDAERMRRFVREAKAASALNHPHVATIYEIGEANGVSFIAMEYVEGQTLAAKINGTPLAISEIIDIGSQIADALDAAHSKGITHRDIKPANVMLNERGQVKVLDFGLAKIAQPQSIESNISTLAKTQSGVVMGTVPYMSPEQALGRDVDHRSDLFSLGVVLYEMATGRMPFTGSSTSETLDHILHSQPDAMARFNYDVPAELERIVRKCLEKERERRYQSARELLVDLKNLKRESESTTSPAEKAENLFTKIKAHRMGVVFALLALVAVIAVVAYLPALLRQKSPAGPATQRPLSQLTEGAGLQSWPSWSPDGRLITYSSDRGGNFDIWVQQIGGGDPIQVTKSPAHDWQPDWSPDGTSIVFRSEREGGGLYIVPALGGNERKISSFGYYPRWSPDSSRILFGDFVSDDWFKQRKAYVVALDGEPPREVQPEFFSRFVFLPGVAWHPDGQRISVRGRDKSGPGFWTIPLTGGPAVKSEITGEAEKQLKEADVLLLAFQWAPSGQYLYFVGQSKDTRNLWRVTVDPQTLRWVTGPERLTTDVGVGSGIALSPNGKNLAYSTRPVNSRIWSLPLDAATGKIKGAGQPVTDVGMNAVANDLSRDGRKLSFWVSRGWKIERWEKSLEEDHQQLVVVEDNFIHWPGYWSRDGTHLVAVRQRTPKSVGAASRNEDGVFSFVIYPAGGGDEQVLTSPISSADTANVCWDWSGDGQWILGSACPVNPGRSVIRLLPIAAAPQAETQARVVTSSEEHTLWQTYFSPDERWISFIAVKRGDANISTIYVVPAAGGEWIRITEGKNWDDKPRWAPDGKTIYFLSDRTGFYNVWGIRFDPVVGKPLGEPFLVVAFDSPSRMIFPVLSGSEFGVAANRLVVTIREVSGNIWTLGNVDR